MGDNAAMQAIRQQMKKGRKNFDAVGVDDLVMLPKVTEEGILDNLRKRYSNKLIYSNIGPVLIAVNPYCDLGISGDDWIQCYKGKFRHELPPHIFALAEETYRMMKGECMNQCVIISGESGAGKTVSAKLIMKYVAAVSGSSQGVEFVKGVILESNPLLEAFGNAKTLRNDNSSRFGKYFEIKFDRRGDPAGGNITNYLLEKSRVVVPQPGERSYHAFYQLLAGADQQMRDSFALWAPENYGYLFRTGTYTVDGINDVQEFQDTCHAMTVMEIPQDTQWRVWQLTASIMHIGNITFSENAKGYADVDMSTLESVANLLDVEAAALQNAILFRLVQSGRGSMYNSPQNVVQATAARDALAKSLYSRQFDYLVGVVNTALEKLGLDSHVCIGVLDIFGFEIFDNNGFEQFCINFVNEKLQQYFIELTLKAEQDEYTQEGITWSPIKFFDNQIVCILIEGAQRQPGIFSIMDDVCATMHAGEDDADRKFLGKLVGAFNSHKHFRGGGNHFQIKHYAGEVNYNVDEFTDKNKDTLFPDIVDCMQTSGNEYIRMLFPEQSGGGAQPGGRGGQKKRPTTAGFKLKNSCGVLMKTLSACEPHYIRCIKPNENKSPSEFDEQRIAHQVKYLGLYENVRVRRAGFAYRAPYARFLGRYKRLCRTTWGMWGDWNGDDRQGCVEILKGLSIEEKHYQMGKTKIFIRYPETLFHLEELVERHDYDMARKIQKAWELWKMSKIALEQRSRVAKIFQGKKERQRDSVSRQFTKDYIFFAQNFGLQDVVTQGEILLFADEVIKLNRRNRPERRDFVLTNKACYLVMRKKKAGEIKYEMTRRTDLSSIQSISLSGLQDNYIILHSSDYDNLFENSRKTEIVANILEQRQVSVNFNNNLTYKIKTGDTRQLNFQHDAGSSKPTLQKTGKSLTVLIAPGLDKNTDSTPKFQMPERKHYETRAAPAKAATSSAPAGGGGGGMGAPRGGAGGAARGGPGRGGPGAGAGGARAGGAAGGPGRGGPGRGGPGAGAGGARGGPGRGGPGRGMGGPGRGGPGAGGGGAARGGPGRGAAGGAARGGGPTRPGAGGAARGGGGPTRPMGGGPTRPGAGGAARGRGGGPAAAAAAAPAAPAQQRCEALYDYEKNQPDELTFKTGNVMVIVSKDAGGAWWECELNGQKGWIPSNYVKTL
eukprot:CAMPEP_0201524616 /NCGR_PEP_ID=MMETSP0161_2-20130828/23827_1 /ASSEMBLY_ACC=CAM_ASM_000251 /TAXON_ID=180227 /ORGANISM="Neoparamoeba aestuarina, Strain SoJaBio B1-5/56/2" /LENGTH=1170 /DNA_ID=CAMNT_0047924107 /DNA_START=39 /DNA_END=3551 /DNA_ORIENTATION=-